MTENFGIWDKIWQNGKETALSQCQQASYSFLSFSPTCQKSKYSNPLTFLHSLFASFWLAFYGMGLPMSFPDKWRVNTTSKSSSYIELFRWKPMTFPFPQCLLLPRMPQQHQTTQLSLHDLVFFLDLRQQRREGCLAMAFSCLPTTLIDLVWSTIGWWLYPDVGLGCTNQGKKISRWSLLLAI